MAAITKQCERPSANPAARSLEPELLTVATRLFWWKEPEEALRDAPRFLAQVMTFGAWSDIQITLKAFGEEAFRKVLEDPPAGVFDPKSWNYWHIRFQMTPVPPLPKRALNLD
jgi:hypothetical protein